MPHINKIRLVNVNFNDAKGIYDDFMMNLSGKSTTYDLINTGGKSLLLLMLLQTVIPNTCLKKEKPIKNIFIGGNTKRTSHCLVEWILDDGYEYKYMLTGFCVRKKQDIEASEQEQDGKLEIDYYNYCYFYNKENKNDIKHLPLAIKENNEKVFMSYDKLRQLLSNLKKDGEPVEIFDSKRDYMKFIEYYGLISAEWKLISEINVSENYIEKYFKENKTSRKLIENFLIKIIDNVNSQNGEDSEDGENQLADTLIELKDNLMEFRKKSDNKNEYLQAKELYQNLKGQNSNLLTRFSEVDALYKKAYESYVFKSEEIDNLTAKIQGEKDKIENLRVNSLEKERQTDKLKIDKLYNEIDEKEKEKELLQTQKGKTEKQLEVAKKQLELAKSQNEYIEYVAKKAEADKVQIQINNLSMNESDIEKEYQTYGYNYKAKLQENLKTLEKQLEEQIVAKKDKESAKENAKKRENQAREEVAKCKTKIEELEEKIKDKQEEIDAITKELTARGKMDLLLNLEEGSNAEKITLENLEKEKETTISKIEEINNLKVQKEKDIIQIKADQTILEEKQKEAKKQVAEYESKKKSIDSLAKTFQCENTDKLKEKLAEELQEKEKQRSIKQISKQMKQRKLELMQKYHVLVPNEEIIRLKEKLEPKCTYVTTGIEKLMEMEENKRNDILNKNPLFFYSIFVDDASFQKMKNKQFEIEVENLVPIASVELLRGEYEHKAEKMIFPIQKKVYQSFNKDNLEECKLSISKTIDSLDKEIETIRQKENEIKGYLEGVNYFILNYMPENVEAIYQAEAEISQKISKTEEKIKHTYQTIENDKEEVQNLTDSLKKLEDTQKDLKEEIQMLEELTILQKNYQKEKELKANQLKEREELQEILEEKAEIVIKIEGELNQLKDKIHNTETQKGDYSYKYNKLPEFKQMENLAKSFEEIKNYFEAISEKMSSSHSELTQLQDMHRLYKEAMEKCEKTIRENNYTLEYFANCNEHFDKVLDSQIEEFIYQQKELTKQCEKIGRKWQEKEGEYNKTVGEAEGLVKGLREKGEEYRIEDRILDLDVIDRKIKENSEIIKRNKLEIQELTKKIETVDKQVKELEKEHGSLEVFINEKEIKPFEVDTANLLSNEVYTYQKIRSESSKLGVTISKLQTEFTNYIAHIKESTESFYIKQDVLDVMQELKIPTKLEEAKIVENGITIIIEQLEEKIRHIEEALRHLEGYQNNFITKCFEKAETIVRDLEKLPGLSRIKIGGKDINIIKIDLFEYEPEEKRNKMKEYIYKIVQEMEENPEETSKEQLNEKLSSKALVAQIINMDKASVKLYKIEDIQEHSTYKKWEDDLGSDGQVNAIYFMFAVCIISYISMLTRKEGSNKTKKVIIADNPFGATSAVFLWNVMFSILKENNVQLIAPGHNINKEIISKFEVNYVLKHEYYNGNKKSVVVDKELRTEDDIDKMNFEVIEGDQQSMF